ncbi:hypothetical protein O3M35_002830 [Rhynocoris fuscipes]|uniref:Uncharacterized protein n=1 Tax=Rhynocoris fuscipes TaxID=488301 RepID=A0AAW1CPA1_9HEMI
MVMRRSGDIKRISKDVSDTLEDNPKRTKVHAQRKFAQGSGMNSPVMTPVKDKEKVKVNGTSSSPELLPSKRPRTEDFLTYLCFRGTEALPPSLDFFNLASKSTKQDKDGSTPGSSKQTSASQQENKAKRVRSKLKKTKAVHSLKNKLHEKRLGTRSTRLSQKISASSSLHTRQRQLEDRPKKVGNVAKKQLVRGRPAHHPAILKRLGAARLRTGLRSGGQLPPGSDVGIKSDRKPRKKLIRTKASKSKKETISRSLASRKKSKDKESDDEDDEDEEEERRNEKNKKDDKAKREKKVEESDTEESESKEVKNDEPARKKSCRMSTRSRASSGSPANPPNTLNLPSRPTRKSKESATLYMEMLTKDLRSPEEEEDDSFGKISTENSPSNKKSLDESSVSTVSSGRKSSKQSKTDDQSADKEKSERENSVASRASRRGGRMKREDEQLNKDDVRITRRQQKIGIQQRGRPALRRGRGRPPLTRTPPFQRVLRNVRKVTNFAENDSETEDEEDEMFVESILSEEMEKLDMDSNKSKTAKSSISSSAKLSKSNVKKVEDVGSDNESEASEQSVKEKSMNRCKTRSHSNSKTNKSVDESSEEDSRRLTRGSNKEKKEEDSVKERKRSLPSRKSRPSKSDSDTERNDNTPKEKLPQKRGRKDSVEKIKEKEIPEKEKPAEDTKVESLPETRTASCSSASKKSFLQDKKEEEDQSVAYLLLSLAQGKGYETETACQPAAGDITTRNTRSFVKEPPKEEARGKRGKRRNTSLDNSVNEENFIEEKPLTSMKRNKRESVASETSSSKFSKTRLSSKDSKDKLNTDDEQDDSFDIKYIKTEDQALRKVQKKEPVSSRNKVQDKVSSDSDEEKVTGRKSLKSNSDDGSALLSSRRARRFRASRDANENSSGSEIDSKVKDKSDIMTEKKDRLRRRSGGLVKNESFDSEIGDIKRDIKTEPKLKKHGSLQSFGTASVKSESCDVQEVNLINSTQKTEERKVNNSNVESLTVNSLIEDSILNVNAINKVLDMIEDVNSLTSGENVKMVTAGKGSLDYSSNQSTSFDDSKTISDKTKGRKTNTDKAEVNIANLNSNELFRGNSIKETSDVRSAVDGNKTCKPEEFKEKDTKREVKSSSFGSSTSVQNKRTEDNSSSSEESDTELNCKSGKDIDRSRKRFPRRSRTEYNRDLPKRTLHTRKVKTMNDKYIEDDSSSSESSSTSSDDAPIAAVKSQKRIKPKNSTQNDAIESAIREAQNAKREEITSQCSKIESYLNKNVYNLPLQTPDKKDSTSENIIQTDFIPRSQIPVTTNSIETRPRENEIVAEKVQIVHQKSPAKVTENSTLIANKSSNKFFNAEKIPHGNIALMTSNVNVPPNDSLGKQGNLESEKKQSMSETWRQAFKNAKIPKPGQSSPVPHGVKPFVRKPFGSPALSTKQSEPMKGVYQNLSKLPNTMNQFKSNPFQSMGKYSPNRPFPNGEESKSQSPSRRAIDMRDSPSKSSVSSSDDSKVPLSDNKKPNEVPVKSLTQLQYEKRSSELISSLKDAPLIIDPAYPVAPFTSLKEAVIEASPSRAAKPASPSPMKPAAEGKHLNLPLAVEHTLRKRSPITVSKKPVVNKSLPQTDKKITPVPVIDKQKEVNEEIKEEPAIIEPHNGDATAPRTSNIEILGKKKVNMTTEEINRWLDDSTSSGIEHAKDCGIFEKNQCECSYRTSSASMLVGRGVVAGVSTENVNNRGLIPNTSNTGTEIKVERGFVEPPVQLRDFAEIASKFGGEIISTYKVEDYREREMLKHKDNVQKQQRRLSSSLKSDRSMTEEEMCEYDFRFDRSSNSPRESGSEMSSPPPLRDDISEKSDIQHISPSERKPIFHQRRSCGLTLKRPSQSKSPAAAFSAENESSVYAFEPEEPPVSVLDKPFRRRSSKGTRDDDVTLTQTSTQQQAPSSSIAVQVNLESEAVLETEAVLECCTTQTEHSQDDEENGNSGRSFYIPIEQGNSQLTPPQAIKGVTLKLEGPNNQRVMLRAKLVTKPPSNFATPSTSHRSLVEGNAEKPGVSGRRRPEQKVRPLSARAPPPVGTVQPTLREATEQNISNSAVTKVDKPKQASQGTQSSPRPPVSATPVCTNPTATPEPAETLKEKRNMDNVEKNTTTAKTENTAFPQHAVPDGAKMLEAPTFYPTEKEFGDPLEYIEKITPLAQHLGICRIVPPPSFKPECKVSDDMRFTAYNQYIHKMYHRWGPNVREMSAIRKYLATQNIALNQPPWIGGIEVDLPRLYQTVQQCGGLKEVYEKKRWTKVADVMKIPKSAQDRVTKLDDIYCKFLLPYDTLSHSERSKLLEEVEVEWKEREKRMMEQDEEEEKEEGGSDSESDSDERDECITKGKSVALSGFFRTARNTMSTWFSKDSTPSPSEVENEFWRHVTTGTAHVCVQSGSIDTSTWGCGFPSVKERSSARHPWNLKILTNNPRSILRSLGPVIGVTVPTLHVGMLFSACCWYRDPHALPWIEYLHTGASKIWYGVPDSLSEELKIAVKRLMPRYCREKKKIWLASDTVMVPPQLLVEHGVSVCKTVQEPGQFVVVFPRAFTSSLCTGYSVSESVYFAHSSWLDTSRSVFKDIQESSEPPIFSLEKLLFNIATDIRTSADVLTQILPMVIEFRDEEISRRKILEGFGLVADEKLPVTKGRRTKSQEEPNEYECEICRGNLFLSLVTNTQDEINYCLVHAIEVITKDKDVLTHCKLMYAYDEDEMEELIKKIKTKIETKSQKKQGKHSITNNSSGSSKT